MHVAAIFWLYGLFIPTAVATDRLVQALEHHEFSTALRERMLAFNKQYLELRPVLPIEHMPCPTAQRYAQRVLGQIIQGSSPALREVLIRADFTVTITVTCDIASLPDAEMKAGILDVSAALILLLASEDEVAAVLAHELAHFTLAHGHKGMENFFQLILSVTTLGYDHDLHEPVIRTLNDVPH
jgi:Zn-dependent protease with chaperone function